MKLFKYSLIAICCIIALPCLFSQELKTEKYSCTSYKTIVNDSNVNIRNIPSKNGKRNGKLDKNDIVYVTGIAQTLDTIDNFTGRWLRVDTEKKTKDNINLSGWIFSKYIDFPTNIISSQFEFVKYYPRDAKSTNKMVLKITGGIHQREITVYPNKLENQSFFTFTWNDDESDFIYSDPAGTFTWNPQNNEIKRITYLGQTVESAWVYFSDDFRYMLEDYGTSPGPRGLSIYDLKNDMNVFSGSYYQDIDLSGHKIKVAVPGYSWIMNDKNSKDIDKESLDRLNSFINKNPINSRDDGLDNTPIVLYSYDMDTGKREYIECKYIVTQ